MKSIVPIANMAGSAGKTTTAVSLASLLAEEGQRVLLVDLDAQANATRWLGHDPDAVEGTSGGVLLRRVELADAALETDTEGLWVVPSARTLDADVLALQSVTGREQRLRTALQVVSDHVDVVLIDCPGVMSLVTVAAMVPATSVLTVTMPSGKELEGLPPLEETIADVRDAYSPDLALGAIVPCIVPHAGAGRLYTDALAALTEAYGALVSPGVRKSVRVPEAYSASTPLPAYVPHEPIVDDYRQVLDHLRQAGIL